MTGIFSEISNRILDEYLELHPRTGRALGLHEFDGRIPDLSSPALTARVEWARRNLAELDRLDQTNLAEQERFDLDQTNLAEQERFDLDLLRHYLRFIPFDLDERRDWEQNPMYYWIETSLLSYLTLNYAPLPARLEGVLRHQQHIPVLLQTARTNLRPPFARPVLEVALASFEGQILYRQNDVAQAVLTANVSQNFRQTYQQANQAAIAALQEFMKYLQAESSRSHDNFAIGAEMYSRLLQFSEGIDVPLAEVLAAGERDLELNLSDFEALTGQIDPQASSEEVELRIRRNHPTEERLVPETEAMLEEIRRFLIEKDLITIPGEIRPLVAPTPAPMKRLSFAMMFTPGPFEQAPEAYYYVTLPDEDWSPEQKEGWLQTFNYPALEDISIHEVYPGHYVHMLHAQQAPSRVSKALKFNITYAEGWAHYAEQMMLEEGYGQGQPEMKLAQLDAALMRDCRYVAAIKMHTQGMSLDEAIEMFRKYGHMAEKPARQEALRGTWQPGYLAYTLGKLMFLRLRADLKARDGQNFNLKAFHNACVEVGVPPFPLLRRKLLGQDSGSLL